MRFKLLQGFHVQAHPSGKTIKLAPEAAPVVVDIRYKAGDVIDTDVDLCALLNMDGFPPKFERIDEYRESVNDGLDEMSVKDLKELAMLHDVDLKQVKSKEGILTILRAYEVKPEPVAV